MIRAAALALLLAACAHPERDLAQCKVVVGLQTDALARCLIVQHDWTAEAAERAEITYDAEVRSKLEKARADCAKLIDSTLASEVREVRQAVIRDECR